MEKVESADSFAMSDAHQSTDQLDKNDTERPKTLRSKISSLLSPFLLSYHQPLPQNPTLIQDHFRDVRLEYFIRSFVVSIFLNSSTFNNIEFWINLSLSHG